MVMIMDRRIETYAKKTFLGLKNPYGFVNAVYPHIIDRVAEEQARHGEVYYLGIKDTPMIPESLIKRLEEQGFLKHTRDRMALGGRALDLQLVNPLTGRWMTGSSSGTALNVFYGMNDVGVGTDGGGSVLAPAAALNLYGFISPLIEGSHMKQYKRMSTDQIPFSPCLGFMAREWTALKRAVGAALDMDTDIDRHMENGSGTGEADMVPVDSRVDIYGSRESLIPYLRNQAVKGKILVSEEGPVDVEGMGDSVFGHFDGMTGEQQRLARKGLMRVVNMCGKSAVAVPGRKLGVTTLLVCESHPEDIRAMLTAAEEYCCDRSGLVDRYFLNLDMYF